MNSNTVASQLASLQKQLLLLQSKQKKALSTIVSLANSNGITAAQIARKLNSKSSSTSKPARVKRFQTSISSLLQEFPKYITAYKAVETAYLAHGFRVYDLKNQPIHYEVDAFLSFVYEKHIKRKRSNVYIQRSTAQIHALINNTLMAEWKSEADDRISNETAFESNFLHLNKFTQVFASPNSIQLASDDDIHEALFTLHSYRYIFKMSTGQPKPVNVFNPKHIANLRNRLTYLIFGSDPTEERIANTIYDPNYQINGLKSSVILELVGWCQNLHTPIINDRIIKTFIYLGFDVSELK